MPKKAKAKPTSLELDSPVEFIKDLPPRPQNVNGKGEWSARFEQLMAKPKQWARIRVVKDYHTATNLVSNFNRKKIRMPDGIFESAARPAELDEKGHPKKGCKGLVFARYMGPGTKAARATQAGRRSRNRDSFYAWLVQYKNDKAGHLGQLARFVLNDPSWPTRGAGVGKVEYLAKHIRATLGGKVGYETEWLEHSWEDYQKYLKGEPISD
jgi:hypothetical protein